MAKGTPRKRKAMHKRIEAWPAARGGDGGCRDVDYGNPQTAFECWLKDLFSFPIRKKSLFWRAKGNGKSCTAAAVVALFGGSFRLFLNFDMKATITDAMDAIVKQ